MVRIATAALAALFLTLSAQADWEYRREAASGKPALKGTLAVRVREGAPIVSVRQFCFAMGCRVFYQWANHRAIIQNTHENLSAIVSSITQVALVDGKVLEFEGNVISDLREGYLLPLNLAAKLATGLKLGKIELRETLSQNPARKNSNQGSEFKRVIIDPGHGGNDWGTGFGSIYEKDVAVVYAQKLKEELKKEMPDLEVLLTREDDRYVSLPDRAKFANSQNANLFLSLHVNHAADAKVEGAETYILSPDATDNEARKLALLENESWLKNSNIKEVKNTSASDNQILKKILVDMEQTKYIQSSALAAALIQQELVGLDRTHGLKSRGVKQAMFYVLSQVAMPSTLVEMGFLSSTGDRSRMMDLGFRDSFVKSIVAALKRYREKLNAKEVPQQ